MRAKVIIRPLASREDCQACVELQQSIWGMQDYVPASVLMIAQKVGAIAAGAFDPGGQLLGCVFGLTGPRDGRLAHWSHFLAVRPEARDRGVGRRLKQYQRRLLEKQQVACMYWSFDPLVARNAHLNLNRLGARVEEYVEDMYGGAEESTVDPLIGTDRFVVRWDLRAHRSRSRRPGRTTQRLSSVPLVNAVTRGDAELVPAELPLPDARTVRIAVPRDVQALKAGSPEVARAWRSTTRRAFRHYLAGGWGVAAFLPSGEYLLERR